MRVLPKLALGACLLAGTALPHAALAQMDSREAIALQNQILELRRDMAGMQQRGIPVPQAGRTPVQGGGGSEIAAQLLDRVQALEEEVRRLRGQLDEQANTARRQRDDLAKQIGDLQFKVGQGGGSGNAAAAAPAAAAPSAVPANPAAARRTPEIAMQEGNAALARRDYPAAEAAAREVIATGKGSPRLADANFLLAQSLAGRRDWQPAAVAYDDAYKANPRGSRAADSLVGLSGALVAINQSKLACATLDKLGREFPSPRADIKDAAATLRNRACR